MRQPKYLIKSYNICKQSGSVIKMQLLKKYLLKNKDYASAPPTEGSLFALSEWVYFCVNVHIDITTLRKYIPTGIKIMFDSERNGDNFGLLSHDTLKNYLIELCEMKMSCKRY